MGDSTAVETGFGGLAGGLVTVWLHPLLSDPLLIECLSQECSQHGAEMVTVAVEDLDSAPNLLMQLMQRSIGGTPQPSLDKVSPQP